MMLKKALNKLHNRKRFSVESFLFVAGFMIFVYLVLHILGVREYTGVLSGTFALGAKNHNWVAFWGLVYIMFYIGTVVIAPILIIAAGLMKLLTRIMSNRDNKTADNK